MFAAYGLLDVHEFVYFFRIKAWPELAIAFSCTLITYMLGVEVG